MAYKKKRPIAARLFTLLIVLAIGGFAYVKVFKHSLSPDSRLEIASVEVTPGLIFSDVHGVAINRTSSIIKDVSLDINLYGESGAQVGTATTSIENLEPGIEWKFDAMGTGEHPKTAKVIEVTIPTTDSNS